MRLTAPLTAIFILGAFVGASAAAGMAALGLLAGQMLEPRLNLPVVSWEKAFQTAALLSALGGVFSGALGAIRANWREGLIAGAAVHTALFAAAVSWAPAPPGVKVWMFSTGVLAGLAAGAIGGELGRRAASGPASESSHPEPESRR